MTVHLHHNKNIYKILIEFHWCFLRLYTILYYIYFKIKIFFRNYDTVNSKQIFHIYHKRL